jgi:hypothetical protein
MKLQFSGHESFICKHFWLKKGYDFITNKGNFNEESAVVELGVGRNMVTSISYWLKAFGIADQSNTPTVFGDYLFNDRNGKDRYIETIGTVWLLHYNLIKNAKASLYSLFFNEFRRERHEFTKEHFTKFILKKIEKGAKTNTITVDIAVFLRSYLAGNSRNSKVDIEDEFSNLLSDLELLQSYQVEDSDGKNVEWYRVQSNIRPDLPSSIFLYTILDNIEYGRSIPFRDLLTGYNSPGVIFALNDDGLYQKIEEITQDNRNIVYKETAGVRELQIKGPINKAQVLDGYYKN